jgi:hypothetical protein
MDCIIDLPEFSERLFFPRMDPTPPPEGAIDLILPVQDGTIQIRTHMAPRSVPLVLLFPGNGETPADLDPIAGLAREAGLSLAVAGYRGYGLGSGIPTLRNLMSDAPLVMDATVRSIAPGSPIIVMGRSLGILSAAAIAASHPAAPAGIAIESGFFRLDGLIERRGFDPEAHSRDPRIAHFDPLPPLGLSGIRTLIGHGTGDDVVPMEEVEWACRRMPKASFMVFGGAGHGAVIGMTRWWDAVADLAR